MAYNIAINSIWLNEGKLKPEQREELKHFISTANVKTAHLKKGGCFMWHAREQRKTYI